MNVAVFLVTDKIASIAYKCILKILDPTYYHGTFSGNSTYNEDKQEFLTFNFFTALSILTNALNSSNMVCSSRKLLYKHMRERLHVVTGVYWTVPMP